MEVQKDNEGKTKAEGTAAYFKISTEDRSVCVLFELWRVVWKSLEQLR